MWLSLPNAEGVAPRQRDLKLREDFSRRVAVLWVNDVPLKSDPEYRGIASYAQRTYGLSDEALLVLYQDYRANYDHACA